MPKTYIVVASYYGEFEELRNHLRSLEHDSYAILTHEQRGPNREVMGYARVYNIMINAAFADPMCERVWVLGDDVLPAGRCLFLTEEMLKSDPTIGIICPIEVVDDQTRIVSPTCTELLFATFACVCLTRKAWKNVGPLDEALGRGYAEDLDWGIRCWYAGLRVVCCQSEWFGHKKGSTYNRLVSEGKFDAKEPYVSSQLVRIKHPFLWTEKEEVSLERLRKFCNK